VPNIFDATQNDYKPEKIDIADTGADGSYILVPEVK
jgi:predicted aspartyl protease